MERFLNIEDSLKRLRTRPREEVVGRVIEILGPTVRVEIPGAAIGDTVSIRAKSSDGESSLRYGEVVGFLGHHCTLAPLSPLTGVRPGAEAKLIQRRDDVSIGYNQFIGAVIDSSGAVIERFVKRAINSEKVIQSTLPTSPLSRRAITEKLRTGIPVIDCFLTIGKGQRIGIFAEPGVGKSTLISQIASNSPTPINVITLIGERKREISEMVFETLDEETRARSIIVASSCDDTPLQRINAGLLAMKIAESFAAGGQDVLLLMDSLSRLVRALRELGLAAGESPVRHGYPPSAFSELPKLLERAGNYPSASITALFTVLQTGELNEDPFVEEIKSLLDGHILLTRARADLGRYPAIDPIRSISRLHRKLLLPEQLKSIDRARSILAQAERDRELIVLGGGSETSPLLLKEEQIEELLTHTELPPEELIELLDSLLEES